MAFADSNGFVVINREFWRWFYRLNQAQRNDFRYGRMRLKPPPGFAYYDYPFRQSQTPAKEGAMSNPMSQDRVHFRLKNTMASTKMFELLYKAFGMNRQEAYQAINNESTVICRPSQFARFLIWRNEMDLRNGFKELEPMLVSAAEEKKVLDVSVNRVNHL